MLRLIIILFLISTSAATTCSQLQTIYSDTNCCSNQNVDTCFRQIPLCSTVTNGRVCVDTGGDIVVKGLLDAFEFPGNQITLKKHIIPDTTSTYDLGNAEYKIRYLFETD